MRLAAIVPFRSEWGFLATLLRSLRDQDEPADELIVVIDGGSNSDRTRLTEQARELLGGRLAHSLSVLCQPWSGAAAARNRGFRSSCSEGVVFLEADGQYSSNYFRLVRSCLANPAVGTVLPELRIALVTGNGWTARYQRARWRGIVALTRAKHRVVLGGWAFRREVFMQVGGYDERLRVGEDRDVVERVRAGGLQIAIARRTSYQHPEPSTFRAMCEKTFRRARQASLFYRLHRFEMHLAARGLTTVLTAAGIMVTILTITQRSASPILLGVLGFVALVVVFVSKAWCEPLVIAAARVERRTSGSHARLIFAWQRAWEQLAAIAGAALGSFSPETSVARGSQTRPEKKP